MIDPKSLLNLRKILDFLIINFSFILSAFFAQPIKELFSNELLFILLLLQNILWFVAAGITNIYSDLFYRSFSTQLLNIIKLVIAETLFTVFFLFLIKENLFTRNFVFYFASLLLIFLVLKEYLVWKSLDKKRSRGHSLRRLIVLGLNEVSEQFIEEISSKNEFGFKFVGYIDDEKREMDNYLGNLAVLDEIILNENIDDVIYSSIFESTDHLTKVQRICDKHAVKLTLLPSISQFSNSNIEINFLGNFPVLTFRSNRLEQYQWRFVKRTFDLLFSLIMLISILWLVFLVIGIIIKLTSRGKVVFSQERIGKNEKIFACYKFRSMREVAENKEDINLDESKRITTIGKILRKYSLDELPQFINVIKGDMSIVGPRPHAVNYNNLYSDMVEEIKLRHRVKPGITGWAQVHGLRGDVFDFEENRIRTKKRIDFDNWYIENWSTKLDVQIIIETVWQIVSGRNLGS